MGQLLPSVQLPLIMQDSFWPMPLAESIVSGGLPFAYVSAVFFVFGETQEPSSTATS